MTDGDVYCAARYCRALAPPGKKYCERHDKMNGGEIIAEGHEREVCTIRISKDTRDRLVLFALEEIARRMEKGKGHEAH